MSSQRSSQFPQHWSLPFRCDDVVRYSPDDSRNRHQFIVGVVDPAEGGLNADQPCNSFMLLLCVSTGRHTKCGACFTVCPIAGPAGVGDADPKAGTGEVRQCRLSAARGTFLSSIPIQSLKGLTGVLATVAARNQYLPGLCNPSSTRSPADIARVEYRTSVDHQSGARQQSPSDWYPLERRERRSSARLDEFGSFDLLRRNKDRARPPQFLLPRRRDDGRG